MELGSSDVTSSGLDHAGLNSLGLPKPPALTRVVVAMSGGVDSSVVAALLKREGYEVIGVTLQLYDHGEAVHRKGACCAGQDIQDARQVADQLGIPHYVLDYEERFRRKVIDPFAQSYATGETPIPCVSCNSEIKFADLFETAQHLGADVLATGHYVSSKAEADGGRALYRSLDSSRDQSYFLFATTNAQLELLRFPLGDLAKPDVRQMARQLGLVVADKADSQDICFVPSGKYSDVIERLSPGAVVPGEILHVDGRVLGRHSGVIHYTIGQRRGLGLGAVGAGAGEPLYVIRLDAAKAQVIVGPRQALATRRVHLRGVNWIGPGSLQDMDEHGLEIFVQVRSTRAPIPGFLHAHESEIWVDFALDEDGVSPGQACVFYENDQPRARVLGGGFISATESALQMREMFPKPPNEDLLDTNESSDLVSPKRSAC
ncbi:tRNA 2-thiouridine(34) synthase MnmA [Beijerinckia indica]|uniref:tRNA-specific 2-thiouridylase MnmA n=1 Tax=Beijerinckia indica subsp. indica (strain ATCC 9039 / DSM 1715 / NCIMB 8712) TaxID=395963 RepID=MNMA_BEII9|nr:tRNA 2-thiouridine(34) synthase MnmA [Beijerinckia indica]B2IBH3.1 RecName: Full=tRNA-specific 2-thiouridylase MnmA [Beijerinckia indica subsp. indica ATCC 9039]ACB96599.1 tRNA (5-methylaminomethyl-2-thiouridylate)-methyltransferase [Beijerinckia indica subsp. indica ATCC 9039]